ncbi:MAG: hypothetical protein K2Z81_01040 [Cyanobacteria bacterium]|nr:hypothetical protein [Cyanobacteriota bacterium]
MKIILASFAFWLLISATTVCRSSSAESAESLYSLAEKEFGEGNFQRCIAYCTESLQYGENRERTLQLRGLAYDKLFMHEKALSDLSNCKPHDWATLLKRSQIFSSLGKFSEASDDLDKAEKP